MSANDDDRLVADYLQQLSTAASAMPANRRTELIDEIASHIAEARAAEPGASGDSLRVRNILERLGDPADIVRAAAEPAESGGSSGAGRDPGALEICAVLFLLIGGVVIPVLGWIVGVILLWISPRWRRREKLLGTLVWPGGLLAPVLVLLAGGLALIPASETACTGGGTEVSITTTGQRIVHHFPPSCTGTGAGLPAWLGITIAVIVMAAAIAGPIFTAARLLRRVERPPALPTAEPAELLPA